MPEVRWVPLAEVARPHGVWGELRLKGYNHDSDLLFEQTDVLVRSPNKEERMMQFESLRGANEGFLLAKFRGVDGRDAADRECFLSAEPAGEADGAAERVHS